MRKFIDKKNEKRMTDTFLTLARIPSLSRHEGKVAAHLERSFKALGCTVRFDGTGKKIGGETGNLIATFPSKHGGKPFLLSSHMDTVGPAEKITPVMKGGRIYSDGTSILGADCKSGITVILETLALLKERGIKHPPLEIAITVAEEIGLLGSKNLDYSLLKAKNGLVLDSESPSDVTVRAPAVARMEIQVHGVAAHAGMFPERGISAIQTAAKAMAKLKFGRIDFETTANIGVIDGGTATNVITPLVNLRAEARSHKVAKLDRQIKLMEKAFKDACAAAKIKVDGKTLSARCDFKSTRNYNNMVLSPDTPAVKLLLASAKERGMSLRLATGGGGSDANIYFEHGILTPNLGCGMWEPHSTKEFLELKDMFDCADLVIGTLEKAA